MFVIFGFRLELFQTLPETDICVCVCDCLCLFYTSYHKTSIQYKRVMNSRELVAGDDDRPVWFQASWERGFMMVSIF